MKNFFTLLLLVTSLRAGVVIVTFDAQGRPSSATPSDMATFMGSTMMGPAGPTGSSGATGAAGVSTFATGGNIGSAATTATTGTMTVSMATAVITITPTGACTFNASGGVVGQLSTFIVTTSGTTSFTLTWGTNFKTTATLATGTTTAKTFCVTFRCKDGTTWIETSRTIAM